MTVAYPVMTVYLEKRFYEPSTSDIVKTSDSQKQSPDSPAISVQSVGKTFVSRSWRGRKSFVTAIDKLSLDIPRGGIFVLLGSNGYVSVQLSRKRLM